MAAALLLVAALAPSITRYLGVLEGRPLALGALCVTPGSASSSEIERELQLVGYDCAACLIALRDLLPAPEPLALAQWLRQDLGQAHGQRPQALLPRPAPLLLPPSRGPPGHLA